MGGPGSGRWGPGYRRKTTVEECYALEAGLLTGTGGRLVWWLNGQEVASVAYANEGPTTHRVRLTYVLTPVRGEPRKIQTAVQLVPTPLRDGGARWWFRCSCDRRVARLYLPPGGLEFACRTCHGLAYQSSLESHRYDGALRRVAAVAGWEGSIGSLRRALDERSRR